MKKNRKGSLYLLVVIIGLFAIILTGLLAIILGSLYVVNHLWWISVIVVGLLILFTVPLIVEAIFPD